MTGESYGLPRNTSISYGQPGFPTWVGVLCDRFGLKASTYPSHQANQRLDIKAAPNPQGLNRGIDWVGDPEKMLWFATWLRDTAPPGVEMVIYQDPRSGERVGHPQWVDYGGDYAGHTDHVHTRFSRDPLNGVAFVSPQDIYTQAIIAEGQRRGITPRGIQIALATALVESNMRVYANAKVAESMNVPHDAVGFDGLSVGLFQQQVKDTGNGWWWSDAATCMNPALSAGLFYDRLERLDYNGPDSPGSYAQAVQRSAFPGRYDERYPDAVALYQRFVTAQPITITEGFLMALSDQQQQDIYDALCRPVPSQSALREPGEGLVGSPIQLVRNIDGMTHIMLVELLARLGSQREQDRLTRVAATNDPNRAEDAALAATILDRIYSGDPAPAGVAPTVTPAPAVPPARPPTTAGGLIGAAYDALEALRLSSTLPPEANAPLHALIDVLQTYPEETR